MALLAIVLVIATAGLVYELVMAAVASYLLGDSVTQFSIIIGLYLSALGLGAYLSRFIVTRLEVAFVDVELGAALVGGLCAPGLFLAFSYTDFFHPLLYGTVLTVGTLVGLELPLLIRILQRELEFKELIARALTFDYAGALFGSLGFSIVLMPYVGLVHSSIASGVLNAGVALLSTWLLRSGDANEQRALDAARVRSVVVLIVLGVAWTQAGRVLELAEHGLYGGERLAVEQSRYQRIALTRRGGAIELYLNGNLQFSARDERRYHEALVHPAMASAAARRSVLIGGGGDGLALREVLRWPDVARVVLVDLDPSMTELARNNPELRALNGSALHDPRVQVANQDAMTWFSAGDARFDVILLDFPDPTNYALGKLYSTRFYAAAKRRLEPGGALAVQATSPLFARSAYWCIERTLRHVGLEVRPYHVFVPSFGDWGFLLARSEPFAVPSRIPITGLSYLDEQALASAFEFARDTGPVATEVNRLNNQRLVAYYLSEWGRWH